MTRARKLMGILTVLALCACSSTQHTTATGPGDTSTGGTTTGPATGTGTTAGNGTGNTGTSTGTGTGTSGTTGSTSAQGGARVDCSTVRCASCPTGQHPALTPPDCCRCVPD